MIGTVKADEGLGVARGFEDDPGIIEAHNLVVRRVDDQQRPVQRSDALALCLPADLAQAGRLRGIGWRGEGHYGACLGHLVGDRQDRCPAK